jgi:hypothetical protein
VFRRNRHNDDYDEASFAANLARLDTIGQPAPEGPAEPDDPSTEGPAADL